MGFLISRYCSALQVIVKGLVNSEANNEGNLLKQHHWVKGKARGRNNL
jgi:hypothetical protein